MKKKYRIEDREIKIPSELMEFAINRVSSMVKMNPYLTINRICAEAYLLACNDMVQIIPIIKYMSGSSSIVKDY